MIAVSEILITIKLYINVDNIVCTYISANYG